MEERVQVLLLETGDTPLEEDPFLLVVRGIFSEAVVDLPWRIRLIMAPMAKGVRMVG